MKNLITSILIFCVANLFGQGFQFATLEYSIFPEAAINEGETNLKSSFQEMNVLLKMPIRSKNEKTVFINSFQYDLLQATIYDAPFFGETKTQKTLHKISYGLMAVHKLNEDWTILARAKPTLLSDLNHKLKSEDFVFQGIALVSKKINEKLQLGAGLVYNNQLGETLLLPALQLNYQNVRHQLKMILPSHFKYLYNLDENEKYKLGVKAKFSGGNYAVSFNGIDKGTSTPIDRAIYSRANAGLLFNMILTDMIGLELFGGMSMIRKYRFKDMEGVTTSFDSNNGGFFTVGLNFNFPDH